MIRRVTIIYGGNEYLVADRTADDLKAEISTMVESGQPTWLTVNWGEGKLVQGSLLLTPGVSVAVVEEHSGLDQPEGDGS